MAQAPVTALKLLRSGSASSRLHQCARRRHHVSSIFALSPLWSVRPRNITASTLDEKEMGEYTRVLEEVQANTAVLPAPPGTVFRSRDNLMRWLELHYFTLTQTMSAIEGHGQARLTVTKTSGVDAGRCYRG